mgnify:FL=1
MLVKVEGKLGDWMYEPFWVMLDPLVVKTKMQQTPNLKGKKLDDCCRKRKLGLYPEAQVPDCLPPLSPHSVEVKQVPLRPPSWLLQSRFWNVTTLKRLNSERKKQIYFNTNFVKD